MSRLVVGLLVLAGAFAGCVATPSSDVQLAGTRPLLAEAAPLWPDPQNAPHPAYGWPTLTHPAVGDAPAHWAPIPVGALPERIGGLEHLAGADAAVASGGGIALFGSLAYVPGYSDVSYVVDISDPAAPKTLSTFEAPRQRGAAIIAYPDGRLAAAVSTPTGFDVVDITDPASPEIVAQVEPPSKKGHKVGVVPGTPILYNANSANAATPAANVPGMGTGVTEIYDLTDPRAPVLVQEFPNGHGCHHIFFWSDGEKHRALCAGKEVTQIWDIADPLAPVVLANVPVHHGNPALPSMRYSNVMFSHFAVLNDEGTVLVVGDEFRGGGPAQCDGVHTPVLETAGPFGNLWFYDVTDESDPKLLAWWSPPPYEPKESDLDAAKMRACTAHHGRLVPDAVRDLLVMAWYAAGVVVVDFTDPARPWMVDQFDDDTDTWEAWYYNGYVFTGDLARGLDVFRFT